MTRIASALIPHSAISDLGRAQTTLAEAARQSASQTKASDLKGYGREAQTLVSAQRLVARSEGFVANTDELKTRMELQNVALGRASDIVSQLKGDLFQNVGLDSGDGIRARLDEAFAVLKDAMNTSLGGRYLFGGVLNDRPPVTASSLSDLAANPLADGMETGADAQMVRIEEGRLVPASLVADDIATNALASLKRLAELDEGPNGPFGGQLTAVQKAALENELTALGDAFNGLLSAQSENGRMLKEVESAAERQGSQLNALNAAIGGIVDVDLAEVAVRLNQAQFAYEASASVFNTLRGLSLINYLD
jgi:flagellar hook-associated protein 3 FlgL